MLKFWSPLWEVIRSWGQSSHEWNYSPRELPQPFHHVRTQRWQAVYEPGSQVLADTESARNPWKSWIMRNRCCLSQIRLWQYYSLDRAFFSSNWPEFSLSCRALFNTFWRVIHRSVGFATWPGDQTVWNHCKWSGVFMKPGNKSKIL